MSTTPAISVRGLSQRFGAQRVLSDVSFEVAPGTVFGFIGPNGAGKTTTLRSMATLHEPDAGHIEIAGVDVRREPERARRVLGYMPDHAGVYELITGAEYLEFFASAQGLPESRVADVVALTRLESTLDKDVSQLSKGMKQRMQLARILLHDPEVLLLDEPASDLDPRARIELRDLVLELRRRGKTILLSSHILTELADVCTHVGILQRGRLVAAGPIGAITARSDAAGANDAAPYRTTGDPDVRGAKLRVVGAREHVARVLAQQPLVSDVMVSELGTVTLRYRGDDRTLGEVVKALVHADVLVCGVEPERHELERLFLELTEPHEGDRA